MSLKFPSDEWMQALMRELNASASYSDAAKQWEGAVSFVLQTDPAPIYLYMDLWHGKCRDARVVTDPQSVTSEFVIEAPLPIWKKVIERKLDPIQGLITRQLKVKGDMLTLLKHVRAAQEMVLACTRIDTEF